MSNFTCHACEVATGTLWDPPGWPQQKQRALDYVDVVQPDPTVDATFHCTRHNVDFPVGIQCDDCAADNPPVIDQQ